MTCIGAPSRAHTGGDARDDPHRRVERVTLGTDFPRQKVNQLPKPPVCRRTPTPLFAEGLTEDEIRCMACTNPSALLSIDA